MAKKRELARRLHQLDTQVAVYAHAVDRLTHRVEELERKAKGQGPWLWNDGRHSYIVPLSKQDAD